MAGLERPVAQFAAKVPSPGPQRPVFLQGKGVWLYRHADLPLRFAVRCLRAVLNSFPFGPSPTSQTRKVNLSLVELNGRISIVRFSNTACKLTEW